MEAIVFKTTNANSPDHRWRDNCDSDFIDEEMPCISDPAGCGGLYLTDSKPRPSMVHKIPPQMWPTHSTIWEQAQKTPASAIPPDRKWGKMSEMIPSRGAPTLKVELNWAAGGAGSFPHLISRHQAKFNRMHAISFIGLVHREYWCRDRGGDFSSESKNWPRVFTWTILGEGIAWRDWQVPVFRTDTSLEWTWVHRAFPCWWTCTEMMLLKVCDEEHQPCELLHKARILWSNKLGKAACCSSLAVMCKLRLWEVLQHPTLPIILTKSHPPLLTLLWLSLLNILQGKFWP